jgi:predicted aldo/keto reductase-like oxidoreductase
MYNNKDWVEWQFEGLKNKKADASSCVECRSCVDKCPQHIDIPEKLKEMVEELDFLFK